MVIKDKKKKGFGRGMNDIRIRVRGCLYSDAYDLVIFLKSSDGMYYVAEPMELRFKRYDPSCPVDGPTLRVGSDVAGDLLDALLEELGDRGIKTQEDSKVEGKLESMRDHLKDMRKLVFEGRIK